jgi:ACS family hexuronate transporter-like MFS transporter
MFTSQSQPEPGPPEQTSPQVEPLIAAEDVKSQADVVPPESTSASATGAAVVAAEAADSEQTTVKGIGYYRWGICALLFFATAINYIDRQVFSILAPVLQEDIGWSEAEYGYIVFSFHVAYAIGLVGLGSLMDRIGTRKGFSLAITFWSIASMAHAVARSAVGFGVARFALALGEAGNFPACVKTVAEWFPKKERALATGIFNSGSNIGAIAAPLLVPFIASHFGWQWAFILTGLLGFIWLAFWWTLYRRPEQHPRLSRAELAYIQSDPAEPETQIPWLNLLPHRQTLAFAIGKFMTDPVWWFFLFWLPKYFTETYNLELTGLALPLVIIYVAADIGSIAGGWLSSALLKSGRSLNVARKTALLVCALCVVPMVFASRIHSLWATVALISLAAAAHQGWSANLYTLVSDTFPRRAVGSVTGIGGMAGSVGNMIASAGIGVLLQLTGSNYDPLLTICSFAYLSAFAIIHFLLPRLEAANFDEATAPPATV